MVNVCVPVLKRYDLLRKMVMSLERSTLPAQVLVINNGGMPDSVLRQAMVFWDVPFDVYTPPTPLGVAASWNYFLKIVPEERVIVNDDIIFVPTSLERLLASKADLVWAKGCGFSCFVLRDSCIAKLGLFDEEISPGYAYYEDDDYLQRLDGHRTREPSAVAMEVECGVIHEVSGTLKVNTPAEMEEHHRKFKIAQGNYVRKWGLEEAFERERVQREMLAQGGR